MKILILSPFGATEPYTEENIGKIAHDTYIPSGADQ